MDTGKHVPGPGARVRDRINWPLVCLLTGIALIRPLFSIAGWSDALGRPATPLILTAAISLAWILIPALTRAREPVLTLVCAGVAYAAASIVLSGILSPILTGELQGPLAHPVAILPMTLMNALWGTACGLCAQALQHLRR
ncbi:hypothetical protein [Thermomonospora cellulosilytica]|uniref:Uncharacterized protein n=1 Tax=Thermomonospora cellulosilytica TaxID=1411118 RepID=A0A7W3MW15_9ACTN|nr:hypothetical protein [Thermomonospora cellulosilytica]MBA9002936.1 hypothetical protein [Thermomonospora cellulosilytica]